MIGASVNRTAVTVGRGARAPAWGAVGPCANAEADTSETMAAIAKIPGAFMKTVGVV